MVEGVGFESKGNRFKFHGKHRDPARPSNKAIGAAAETISLIHRRGRIDYCVLLRNRSTLGHSTAAVRCDRIGSIMQVPD
ncbi:hypothetical protein EVAR_48724_1 [Eumeta japonica]|uniref:Uncharacterized protein n=1 Tax=Eumeta variegata TaxID=151549 RepID=A0A4C1T2C0_EUMVA|nr:hypothetical protein EVAR_48724_1 [Eumeta japonica]